MLFYGNYKLNMGERIPAFNIICGCGIIQNDTVIIENANKDIIYLFQYVARFHSARSFQYISVLAFLFLKANRLDSYR